MLGKKTTEEDDKMPEWLAKQLEEKKTKKK
jgi:hypothetical protein